VCGRNKPAQPGHLRLVHIEHIAGRVDGRPTPLRAAIKAGKNDSQLAHGKRQELPIAAQVGELLRGPGVHLRSSIGEHVGREALATEGLRRVRLGLRR